MRFKHHLFISYAHLDNQALSPDQQGWITRLHATLTAQLSMRLGRRAEIWRDDKLRGNDVFADEIVQQFPSTAILVSVLTPRYLMSEWCTRELRAFCDAAQASGGLVRDNRMRVFKVLKSPVESQQALPESLQAVLGYEFFSSEDGAPLELDPAYGEKYAQSYFRKVGILAWDAARLLEDIEAEVDADAPPRAGFTVYLAEGGRDRRDDRERLEAELKLHGHTVLPDHRLPLDDEADCRDAVRALLARADLVVHLVGATGGAVPDGACQQSVTVLQNTLAAERSRAAGVARIVWLPRGTASEQPAQAAFIQAMHEDEATQFGADLVIGDFEELKATVHAALKRLSTPAPPPSSAATEIPLVYLVCDERDRKATIPLRRFLEERGVEVDLPAFEGQASAVREANQKLFAAARAVIVYYGAGDEAWKRTTDNELKKLRALRDAALPLPWATFLAAPASGDKQDLIDLDKPNLIDSLAGLNEPALEDFVARLKRR